MIFKELVVSNSGCRSNYLRPHANFQKKLVTHKIIEKNLEPHTTNLEKYILLRSGDKVCYTPRADVSSNVDYLLELYNFD